MRVRQIETNFPSETKALTVLYPDAAEANRRFAGHT